jgi:cytochrome c-type biogenesis protein CcsB
MIKKILSRLFSASTSGLYMILFAVSIGVATFIENDYGTSAAQKVVYRATWFEVLLVLFGISILVNVIRYRMFQNKKWAILTFHLSVIFILLGSAITRFYGSEGRMHIREGATANTIITDETYLTFIINDKGQDYRIDENVFFASLGRNHFDGLYQVGDNIINVELTQFVPNPKEEIVFDENGVPIMQLVLTAGNGRQEYVLKYGEEIRVLGTTINFSGIQKPSAVNMMWQDGKLTIISPKPLTQMTLANQERITLDGAVEHPLMVRTLYGGEGYSFVISDFKPKGNIFISSASQKITSESSSALQLKVNVNGEEKSMTITGSKGFEGRPNSVSFGNTSVSAAYGSIYKQLPFAIKLNDFILERYPGTNSASSYASEVTLVDARKNVRKDFRIYMNNILDHDGYRFFQSSFDRDELGTVLSVNHDFWGTWVSYFGYFLITLGMVLIFFSPKSRFTALSKKLKKMKASDLQKAAFILPFFLTFFMINPLNAEDVVKGPWQFIDADHAEKLSYVNVQDHNGRFKPFHTLSYELVRKISKKQKIYDLSPPQVLLGMITFPNEWADVPLIKLPKHEDILKILNVEGPLASYNDFFTSEYKLKDLVREAYNKEAKERGMLEKELIKVDEKVNICNLVFSGRLIKLFPIENDPDNRWISPADVAVLDDNKASSQFIKSFFSTYALEVRKSVDSGNWAKPNQMLNELQQFQVTYGNDLIPSPAKTKLEILLNESNIFSKLGMYYGLLGLLILAAFFTSVFNHKLNMTWPSRIAVGLMFLLFLMHTAGLGMRWIVSGHAPWSNGYESMIYIGWTTILAGLIFARKSLGGLAATTILAATILMVAWLSYLDPEITPLVPVLKSYWLTIHVSLEAGSYGFLMLGAIIGVLNLVLMIFANEKNRAKVYRTVKEMTIISEMTLIGGLVMISVGTYLGGVWANESWGRYWGWDAKETWALVTILIYTFILHMRFIPGFKSLYAFNIASLFGWASVVMTYFGVNYYLSGLHSYAAGDPIPIPSFVYYSVAILTILGIAAYYKNRRFGSGQMV